MKGKLHFGSNKMSFDPDRYDDAMLGAIFRSLIETQIDEIASLILDEKSCYSWEREIKFEIPDTWEEVCRETKERADAVNADDDGIEVVEDDWPEAGEI